ncbi:hypothetical protein AB0J86_18870 [Micromonospora sp. NPDC049559]|uniref:hypothetical protein n=1 Tax=Micromonospora sp. NPDC049559 TaxID=3155923 RepID=UPI0034370BEF
MPGEEQEGVELALSALHNEARKWRRLAEEMGRVRADANRLELSPSAFFFADVVSVTSHHSSYAGFHEWFVQLLADAGTEFERIGGALDRSADAYADSDTRAGVDLTSIYGTRPEGN